MRKRLISVCIIVILIFSICGCAQTAEDTLVVEAESEETENADAEEAETTEDESEVIEFENEDVPWEMQRDYMAQVKELDLTFFEDYVAEQEPEKESCIDTEQVISDFLSMDSIEFLEKYDRDDLYYSGILYCGREVWRYDGGQENYIIENITAIRFYKKQPVPVYLNMNVNDQFGQYNEEISVDYHTDYAVSIYTMPSDNDLSCIQEISFVKVELNAETAPKDIYDYIEYQYYQVLKNLKNETWILSPDEEKAACISNGGMPKLPSQIFIWYEDNKPFTVFRRIGWHELVGWIDNDHLVCYHVDGYPILAHLERNEIEEIIIEEIIRENCDLYTDGAKYSVQGSNLIGQFIFDKQYQWQIQEKDGEIYIVEPD